MFITVNLVVGYAFCSKRSRYAAATDKDAGKASAGGGDINNNVYRYALRSLQRGVHTSEAFPVEEVVWERGVCVVSCGALGTFPLALQRDAPPVSMSEHLALVVRRAAVVALADGRRTLVFVTEDARRVAVVEVRWKLYLYLYLCL